MYLSTEYLYGLLKKENEGKFTTIEYDEKYKRSIEAFKLEVGETIWMALNVKKLADVLSRTACVDAVLENKEVSVKEVLKKHGILVERFNGMFIMKLRKLCRFGSLDWGEQLEKTRLEYLNSYHRIIKCTPLEKSMMEQKDNLPVYYWWSKLKMEDFVMFSDKSVSRDKLDPKYTHKGEILEKMLESARL
ncbi:reverse transcriptase domain-containing protein [Vairimorpha necatrix]|uniref:Reverse transcriptase domain-containing protein n=1 Tax=Vairimorpha necatrix TaxID=6039 RepID=A0AAX4J855_9MICR